MASRFKKLKSALGKKRVTGNASFGTFTRGPEIFKKKTIAKRIKGAYRDKARGRTINKVLNNLTKSE